MREIAIDGFYTLAIFNAVFGILQALALFIIPLMIVFGAITLIVSFILSGIVMTIIFIPMAILVLVKDVILPQVLS